LKNDDCTEKIEHFAQFKLDPTDGGSEIVNKTKILENINEVNSRVYSQGGSITVLLTSCLTGLESAV
jgi:hypothetical protein